MSFKLFRLVANLKLAFSKKLKNPREAGKSKLEVQSGLELFAMAEVRHLEITQLFRPD